MFVSTTWFESIMV